jgi:hypothetical protein
MPHDERERLGIARDYAKDPAENARAIACFEKYMAEAVRLAAANDNVLLVLVGDVHRQAMEALLGKFGDVIRSAWIARF